MADMPHKLPISAMALHAAFFIIAISSCFVKKLFYRFAYRLWC